MQLQITLFERVPSFILILLVISTMTDSTLLCLLAVEKINMSLTSLYKPVVGWVDICQYVLGFTLYILKLDSIMKIKILQRCMFIPR